MAFIKLKRARSCNALESYPGVSSGLASSISSLSQMGGATAIGRDPLVNIPPFPPQPVPTPAPTHKQMRGELDVSEKYAYDLSKAQLKATTRNSALLAGFAMVALIELQYDETTPHAQFIVLGVVTTLLVSVHLLALMMSTCILPHMEATGCTRDSPHIRLKFYIELSWFFSTCVGLLLFLIEIGVIYFVKFHAVHYDAAAYVTTAMLIPIVIAFIVISYLIHKNRVAHSIGRFHDKVDSIKHFFEDGRTKISPIKVV